MDWEYKNGSQKNSNEFRTKMLVLLMGFVILATFILLFWDIIYKWKIYASYAFILQIPIFIVLFFLGIAVILTPFGNHKLVGNFIKAILFPVGIFVRGGEFITPFILAYLVLVTLISIPVLFWLSLKSIGILMRIDEKVVLYIILTLTLIIFTFYSDKIARWIAGWTYNKNKFSKLKILLKPSLTRISVYALMTLVYFISNIEDFSGA